MSQIRQFQLSNDLIQDRLLLRVAMQSDEEYRIWITRRFLRNIWPHLALRVTSAPLRPSAPKPEIETGREPSYDQAFRDEKATYPLGSTPLLANELTYEILSDGNLRLSFREGKERQLTLPLPLNLLEVLLSLLRGSAEQLAWDLVLDYPQAPASDTPPTPSSPIPPKTRLH